MSRYRPYLASVALVAALACAAPAHADPGKAQKRYKATRALVVDRATGQARMPTQQEVDAAVASLAALAKQDGEGLAQLAGPSGAVGLDLDGGFGGVMLSRPAANGGLETLCVFTFEDGIAFLGLVEDLAE